MLGCDIVVMANKVSEMDGWTNPMEVAIRQGNTLHRKPYIFVWDNSTGNFYLKVRESSKQHYPRRDAGKGYENGVIYDERAKPLTSLNSLVMGDGLVSGFHSSVDYRYSYTPWGLIAWGARYLLFIRLWMSPNPIWFLGRCIIMCKRAIGYHPTSL